MKNVTLRKSLTALGAVAAGLAALTTAASRSGATPAFARQYHAKCNMCHTVFPQLNNFGKAFLANNFRIPGEEKTAPSILRGNFPFSIQAIGTVSQEAHRDPEFDKKLESLQRLGSGLLNRDNSFYLHHHILEDERPGHIYEAWVQHSFPGKANINVRVGQFEQPLGFAPEITRLSRADYLIYGTGVGGNNFSFSAPGLGLQFAVGRPTDATRFWLTVTQPVTERDEGNPLDPRQKFGNVFLRVQQEMRGWRVGGFANFGEAVLHPAQGNVDDRYSRFGLDAEAERGAWRVYGLWLTGQHSDPAGDGVKGSLNGGFVGVDYRFGGRYVAYARYDRANAFGSASEGLAQGTTLGLTADILNGWRVLAEYQHLTGQDNFALSTRIAF